MKSRYHREDVSVDCRSDPLKQRKAVSIEAFDVDPAVRCRIQVWMAGDRQATLWKDQRSLNQRAKKVRIAKTPDGVGDHTIDVPR